MYAEMHILSPLVVPREFCFLRYCQQIEAGVWIVADVSYDYRNENILPSRSWRFPSGCMIQETLNGFSKVSTMTLFFSHGSTSLDTFLKYILKRFY